MDDDLPDWGHNVGLPAGYVDCHVAVVRYCRALAKNAQGQDLAPWVNVTDAAENAALFDRSPEEYIANAKRNARATAAFQRAFLTGSLVAHVFDGRALRELPKAALTNTSVVETGLRLGLIEIDPLWPDDWRPWSGHGWVVPKAQFEAWMASAGAYSVDGLPPAISLRQEELVNPITVRRPSDRVRVPLSEAVSWIAFGIALDAERFDDALRWSKFAGGDIVEAQERIKDAVSRLTAAGADGKIAFYGRHHRHNEKGATSEPVPGHKLDEYRKFLIGHDSLYHGDGLLRTFRAPNDSRLHSSDRDDLFSRVTVDRERLMQVFPSHPVAQVGAPLQVSIGGLTYPEDDFDPRADVVVAPWFSAAQAIAWIATRSAAYTAHVASNEAYKGDDISRTVAFNAMASYVARNCCQCEAQALDQADRWQHCRCAGDAGRSLLEAVRKHEVDAIQPGQNNPRKMEFFELAGVGLRQSCDEWLFIEPQPLFSSNAVRDAFPAMESERPIGKAIAAVGMRTGDPGRPPKGFQLYMAEHRRRCDAGEALEKVAHEAEHLAQWYAIQFPSADPVSPGTVENRIREQHRHYSGPKPHENIVTH